MELPRGALTRGRLASPPRRFQERITFHAIVIEHGAAYHGFIVPCKPTSNVLIGRPSPGQVPLAYPLACEVARALDPRRWARFARTAASPRNAANGGILVACRLTRRHGAVLLKVLDPQRGPDTDGSTGG